MSIKKYVKPGTIIMHDGKSLLVIRVREHTVTAFGPSKGKYLINHDDWDFASADDYDYCKEMQNLKEKEKK